MLNTQSLTQTLKRVSRKIATEIEVKQIIPGETGATYRVGSDSYACTIVEVSPNGKKIWTTDDSTKPAKGFNYFSNQVYEYTTVLSRPRTEWTLRKNGYFVQAGAPMKNGRILSIGNRRYYSDPSF
jgi:hypothetical protein